MCGCDANTHDVCGYHVKKIREQAKLIERVCAGSGGLYNSAMEGLRQEYGSRRVDIALAAEANA